MESGTLQGFALSPPQRHLWRVSGVGGEGSQGRRRFRATCDVVITGPCDLERLRAAIGETCVDFEILRTVFRMLPGMGLPLQVVIDELPPRLEVHDLRGLPPPEQAQRLRRCTGELADAEFDLKTGPLLWGCLARLAEGRAHLWLSVPSLCADAAGLCHLLGEIVRCYEGSAGDGERLQFIDLSEWQNGLLEAEETAAGREYWRGLDVRDRFIPRLPGELEQGGDAAFAPQAVTRQLPAVTVRRLEELAGGWDVEFPSLLLAAWQLLLARLSGERRLIVGVSCDGRHYQELEDAVGIFARQVPVVAELHQELSFSALATAAGEAWEEAAKWQDCFVWNLLAGCEDDRPEHHGCPFGFACQERPTFFEGGGARFEISHVEAVTERPLVALEVSLPGEGPAADPSGGLRLRFVHDTHRLPTIEAQRLGARFAALLTAIGRRPAARLSELEMLTRQERHELLVEFNDTATGEPWEDCISRVFGRQAARTPEAVAVRDPERELTYGELQTLVHRLAHHLQGLGVEPESRVGIFCDRSIEAVIGVLAVLEAGGSYVPLDPTYPASRSAFMVEDAGLEVLVISAGSRDRLPPATGVTVVDLDRDQSTIAAGRGEEAQSDAVPGNLAYVIYTSGSTGRPKGVAVAHRQLVASTGARRLFYRHRPQAFLLLSSLAFDSSVVGLFWTLSEGGTLVLPAVGSEREAPRLLELVRAGGVSHLLSVPSLYSSLLELATPGDLDGLRAVLVAGEACSRDLVRRHRALLPHTALFNEYGPTEATVWTTVSELAADDPLPVSIGRPIADARVYILDRDMRPLAKGVAGELYLGGRGLSRGYLHRPAATAERFVPDGVGPSPGGRLYRTGDLVRHLTSGELEFLGRTDHQVKVRGFRVEPGEIEAALMEHPQVTEAVVTAPPNEHGERRLVACYAVAEGEVVSDGVLRGFLEQRLPAHLVPTWLLVLAELPRTPNGKVDRAALPTPEEFASQAFVAPRTPTEETLAGIWAEVLGVERVGRDDNFFDRGGHSLAATRSVARIQQLFQIELLGRSHFEHPQLAGLAAEVDRIRRQGQGLQMPPIEPLVRPRAPGGESELPISFAQQRLWFMEQLDPGTAAFNIPLAVRLAGRLDRVALRRAFNEIFRRHEALRSRFPSREGQPVQLAMPASPPRPDGGVIELPLIELAGLSEEHATAELPRLIQSEIRRPFKLRHGPLLRTSLVRLGAAEHVLLLSVHHIVSDGWSMGLLVRELAALYDAFVAGRPSPLPEPVLQYAEYAAWQQSWLKGGRRRNLLAYWREQLADLPPLELPMDYPRPPHHNSSRGGRVSLHLGGELRDALVALSRRENVTLFMTVVTAFKVLLFHYTGQEDLAVGTNVANREHPETEGIVGLFVNQLVLRTRLADQRTFREFLAQVRDVALEGYRHQDIPFDQLVEELEPDRSIDRPLLFQVKVEVQSAPPAIPEFPGLTVRMIEIDRGVVRYDLHLYAEETEEGLTGALMYNSDLFARATMEEMARLLGTLLAQVVERPDAEVNELVAELAASSERALRRRRQDRLRKLKGMRRTVLGA